MDILLKNYSLFDPLIPMAALIAVFMTRKFTHIWPAALLAAAIIPMILLLLLIIDKGGISFLWTEPLWQEKLQKIAILRLVIASFWALFFWWGGNRLKDHMKK